MTDTTTTAAPTVSTATTTAVPVAATAIDSFFAKIKADFQMAEEDVILVCQNIGAGVLVAAEDIQQCFGWLGGHIGQIAGTINAVQSSVVSLNAAGVPIPASLMNAITQMTQATAGVSAALTGQAVTSDASSALTAGYTATKSLAVAASTAASIAALIQAATAPAAVSTQAAG